MLFRPPFLTASEGFVENTISNKNKSTTPLFYLFKLNPAYVPLADPLGRGCLHRIGRIHQSHAVGGANSSTMVVMFVDCCVGGGRYIQYYSYRRNPTGREFFVPARTLITPCWSDPKVPIVTLLGWYLGVHKRFLNRPNQGSISVRLVLSFNLVPRFS